MITKEVINSILGISESYELPERMMSFLFDDSKREKMFDMFMEHSNDLTHDWFTSYFEEEHSNKTKMAQDERIIETLKESKKVALHNMFI